MKRKKGPTQKTPLKQTRISNFFQKGSAKRVCTETPDGAESPDVIVCTPSSSDSKPSVRSAKQREAMGRKCLFGSGNASTGKVSSSKSGKNSTKKKESLAEMDSDKFFKVSTISRDCSVGQGKELSSTKRSTPKMEVMSEVKSLFNCIEESEKDKRLVSPRAETPKKQLMSDIKSLFNCLDECGKEHSSPIVRQNEVIREQDLFENVDSAFFENTPPSSDAQDCKKLLKTPIKTPPKNVLQNSNVENIKENLIPDFGFDDFQDGWSPLKQSQEKIYPLCFESCKRCVVISTESRGSGRTYEQVLILKEAGSGLLGRCLLRDMWAFGVEISPHEDANICGKKIGDDWVVDSNNGYLCLHPDLLVSSTSLTSAIFCRRRGVLSNVFRGLDSDSRIMTIGSLVHELLQKSLEQPRCTRDDLEKVVDDLLTLPASLRMLYACNMTMDATKLEINYFIPFILSFLKIYVTQEEQPIGKNFSGVITEVVDIEESVASVNFGVKGRVDATVTVKLQGRTKLMPLELKTGRASFSTEHRSQVILYTMMMSEVGHAIESGLLLYIKEGIMEEIVPSKVEIRDLVLLRNDFAKYLKQFKPSNLPEPIRLINGCKRCPYLTVCTAFLDDSVGQKHPFRSLDVFIEPSHLLYFQTWAELLLLEDSGGFGERNDLKMTGLSLEKGLVGERKYFLKRNDQMEESSLAVGNFVNVIAESSGRIYKGHISELSSSQCVVSLNSELTETSGFFSIEAYRSTLLTRYMSNLGCLLEEQHSSLRSIIIDKEPAKFSGKVAKSTLSSQCLDILKDLNEDQRRAVLKVLTCGNYVLIEGPPGTGKTQTVAALIRILLLLNQTVLLVGHTHSSVDNVLQKIPMVEFLRIGSLTSIHPSLHDKSYIKLSQNAKSLADIEALLNRNVLASTCLGLDADIIANRKFDVCIVDESSQVLQPEVLKPLFAAKKFVLLGDPKQLGPVVKNSRAKELGMNVSIFDRLYSESAVVTLTHQYRMNSTIMNLANSLTYNGILQAGSPEIASKVFQINGEVDEKWLRTTFSSNLQQSIMFLDTSQYLLTVDKSFSCCNPMEAGIVKKLVETLVNVGISVDQIGVMAPFRAQIQKLAMAVPFVEINTVDQYQGRDKEVIIISLTRQDRNPTEKNEFELLNDEKRLNVAITRAKFKLILIGDRETLVKYKTFKKLFDYLSEDNILLLEDGVDDFSWPDCDL